MSWSSAWGLPSLRCLNMGQQGRACKEQRVAQISD
jgi:hypothetical protein